MELKVCSGKYGCGKSKPLSEFCLKKAKNGKYYQNSYCNSCNSKAASKYQKDHSEEKSEYNKEYVKNNKERHDKLSKEWYKNNKEKVLKRSAQRYQDFKEDIFKKSKERYHTDLHYKIALNLRRRMSALLRGNWKVGSAIKDLGCTIEEFKNMLESMFYKCCLTGKEMTWANYGTEWHIDHIIPLNSFDLSDIVQFKKACHYTNLQPLWARHNLTKHNKIMSAEEIEKLKTT
jgi:hypothetical protein